ncbi:MAG: glucokinase [Burkholderiaceae bacterium]
MLPISSSSSSPPRIVADIGGTNGRFAIVRDGRLIERREYRNADFPDLATLMHLYLADAGRADDPVKAACIAVAAPISADGEAKFTNAPWQVSARGLEQAMGLAHVSLINDFSAQAYGVATLGAGDVEMIAGSAATDDVAEARAVFGPGTGLGCAALVPAIEKGGAWVAVTSEGGHMGYSATTPDDRRIFDLAFGRYGRVSWERVCCGAGLALVHAALWPDDALAGVADGDPSEVVRLARADASSRAGHTVRQYAGMLGSFAGDLALVFKASGGIYLTGGVLAHLGDAFDRKAFLQRFVDKGRYREWLGGLAVHLIVADDCALRGCANYLEQIGH